MLRFMIGGIFIAAFLGFVLYGVGVCFFVKGIAKVQHQGLKSVVEQVWNGDGKK